MESSISVANSFIAKSFEEGSYLTPMKLLKLVYIAHGWYLGIEGEPLISEQVQAWRYGPVIPSIYHEFKKYGDNRITQLAHIFTETGQIVIPVIEDAWKNEFIDKIWDVYKGYNGLQLSTLTHQEGTPWDIVWNKENGKTMQGAVIRDSLIEEHYKSKKTNAAV